jgi:hypothetical protein
MNASVPPILGAAQGLDWLGSDLYYNDDTAIPPINASVRCYASSDRALPSGLDTTLRPPDVRSPSFWIINFVCR